MVATVRIGIAGKLLYLFAVVLLGVTVSGYAQDAGTGAISGVVYDPANRLVVNAEVQAVNESTHVSRSVMTTAEGVFRVPLLMPGTYSVKVRGVGFAETTSHSIQVTVSQTTSLSVTLRIAGVSQSVQVANNASAAELESSTLGGLVDESAAQALPLSSRN